MRRLVTISYTGLNAGGGVPKFNRDLHSAFPDRECVHFCWDDSYANGSGTFRADSLPEWTRARVLNEILIKTKQITPDDVIIADGFWAAGLESFPLAISHSHGIWSHLTKEDVDAGKEPDMPLHHAAQVAFRKRWTQLGKPLTAVSNFIRTEMERQWDFKATVIDNGVDSEKFVPAQVKFKRERPIIIHGVNDRTNKNKGWDHIELLIRELDAEILSLDEMVERYGGPKEWALAQGDIVVHPSGFEGNSMFILEALSSGLPVVGYDVGFIFDYGTAELESDIGKVIDRRTRSPQMTLMKTRELLDELLGGLKTLGRAIALSSSLQVFRKRWRSFVEELECR